MGKIILFLASLLTFFNVSACESVNLEDNTEPIGLQMAPFHSFEQWEKRQGGAIYNDMLVCFNAMDKGGNPKGFIYDVNTGMKLCDMMFSFNLDGKDYYPLHANQVSFGNQFYNDESDFPLLYISQVNGGNGRNDIRGERGVLVYNLKKIGEQRYEPELVQAIIPDLNDLILMNKLGKYTPNYIVDTDRNQLIVIGYPQSSWYDLTGSQPIVVFNVPDITDGTEIVLTNDKVVDSYSLSVTIAPQQSFYYEGRIFSAGGDRGQASLRVINLAEKIVEYYCDMTMLTKGEPQFLGLWRGKVLYYEYDSLGLVYELFIPGYTFGDNWASELTGTIINKDFPVQERAFNLQGNVTNKAENGFQIIVNSKHPKRVIYKHQQK